MAEQARQEPHNKEAEEYVLGACMMGAQAVEKCLTLLEPEHFYAPSHGLIFGALRDLYLEGEPCEALTVRAKLEQAGALDKVGGNDRILELAAIVPASANVQHYAEMVVETWRRRELLRPLARVAKDLLEGRTAEESLQKAERVVIDARTRFVRGRRTVVSSQEAAGYLREKLENPPELGRGIKAPFRFLQRLQNGRLYVLGGYAADGKTATAVQYMKTAADEGERVGFVTVEMTWEDLTDRVATSYGVPYHMVQNPALLDDTNRELYEIAAESMEGWSGVDLIDDDTINLVNLTRYQKLGRYGLLIVDHLHRFDWSDRRDLERAVIGLTNLSKRENVPVLLLCQLRRQNGKDDKFPRPTMADLRESGMIEAEASMVSFIWRKRKNDQPTADAELIVAKNRYGKVGRRKLRFLDDEVRFIELGAAEQTNEEEAA